MKKLLFFMAGAALSFSMNAQIGATAPDFSVVDIDGNEINLYADILDQGLIAVVDVSATWCSPCWALHESHVLSDLQDTYGPNGTNQLRVVYYEADASTTMEDVLGNTSQSMGDWTDGATYPIVNESPLQLDLNIWAPFGFPTVNIIDPSNGVIVADPWNVFTLEGQVAAINAGVDGSPLVLVGVEEISKEADLNVYPNPTSDFTNLNLSGFSGDVTVQVFDLLGKEVISFQTFNAVEVLDFTALNQGNYIVRAFDTSSEVTKRISVIK